MLLGFPNLVVVRGHDSCGQATFLPHFGVELRLSDRVFECGGYFGCRRGIPCPRDTNRALKYFHLWIAR